MEIVAFGFIDVSERAYFFFKNSVPLKKKKLQIRLYRLRKFQLGIEQIMLIVLVMTYTDNYWEQWRVRNNYNNHDSVNNTRIRSFSIFSSKFGES